MQGNEPMQKGWKVWEAQRGIGEGRTGLATSVCQVRRDTKELGLTELDTERSW